MRSLYASARRAALAGDSQRKNRCFKRRNWCQVGARELIFLRLFAKIAIWSKPACLSANSALARVAMLARLPWTGQRGLIGPLHVGADERGRLTIAEDTAQARRKHNSCRHNAAPHSRIHQRKRSRPYGALTRAVRQQKIAPDLNRVDATGGGW